MIDIDQKSSVGQEAAALHIKLDELLSKVEGGREELFDLEEVDEGKLESIHDDSEKRAEQALSRKDSDEGQCSRSA